MGFYYNKYKILLIIENALFYFVINWLKLCRVNQIKQAARNQRPANLRPLSRRPHLHRRHHRSTTHRFLRRHRHSLHQQHRHHHCQHHHLYHPHRTPRPRPPLPHQRRHQLHQHHHIPITQLRHYSKILLKSWHFKSKPSSLCQNTTHKPIRHSRSDLANCAYYYRPYGLSQPKL